MAEPTEKLGHDSVPGGLERRSKDESDPVSGSEVGEVEAGTVNEKALLRKIDWRLLPAVGILYLLSFLDRSNVGNARIEGLADDLHMTGNQYLTGLTLYFIGYVLFEVRTDPFPSLNLRYADDDPLRFPATLSSREQLRGSGSQR